MTDKAISPLRRRLIEDMTIRRLSLWLPKIVSQLAQMPRWANFGKSSWIQDTLSQTLVGPFPTPVQFSFLMQVTIYWAAFLRPASLSFPSGRREYYSLYASRLIRSGHSGPFWTSTLGVSFLVATCHRNFRWCRRPSDVRLRLAAQTKLLCQGRSMLRVGRGRQRMVGL
jgi:hypothetical protein